MDHFAIKPGIFMDELHFFHVCRQQFQENYKVNARRRSFPSGDNAVSGICRTHRRKAQEPHSIHTCNHLSNKGSMDVHTMPQAVEQMQPRSERRAKIHR